MENIQLSDCGYINGIAQHERITELSEDQEKAIDSVKDFVENSDAKYMVIGGVAGSGKSTIIPYIIEVCGKLYNSVDGLGNIAVCAYTGKAVMNLKRRGIPDALTLHSFLYSTSYVIDPVTNEKKMVQTPKPPFFFNGIRLLVVDEASMLNKEMFDLIMKLPFKALFIGDHFQLPPVNDNFNIMLNPSIRLERIHRQEQDNPIVMLADMARHGQPLPLGVYGSSKHTRTLNTADLVNYDEVITWTNAVKDTVNSIIRREKGFVPDTPQVDDKMIVRVNCKAKNVYNGQIVYLVNNPLLLKTGAWQVEFVDELAYNDPFIMAQTDGATVAKASVHLPKAELDKFRNMPAATLKEWRMLKKSNPYEIHLDWGYAITCHAAQGTSWGNVAIMLEDRMRHVMDRNEYNRFVYTAITRAEESVTVYSGDFRNLK